MNDPKPAKRTAKQETDAVQASTSEPEPNQDLQPAPDVLSEVTGGKPNPGKMNFEHYFDKAST